MKLLVEELDQGGGVLVLTDLLGSTPTNIAQRLLPESGIRIVAGVNLGMLLNVLNYPSLALADLVEKAVQGGRGGVLEVGLVNKLGLHARAAACFVKLATTFDCEINVAYNGKKVSGKSIMGIMMLAAAKDSTLEISASGPDENKAIADLEDLVAARFGESE